MKTLFLMRHAKSCWEDPTLADHDRPLNARGLRDAPIVGAFLGGLPVLPQLFYSSTAKRAAHTAELVVSALGHSPKQILWMPELYHASAGEWMYCLHHLSAEADRVMLFGHNPGLEVLAYQLAGEIFAEKFPTAAVAVLQFNIWNWADVAPGAGALLHFFTPRMLLNPA